MPESERRPPNDHQPHPVPTLEAAHGMQQPIGPFDGGETADKKHDGAITGKAQSLARLFLVHGMEPVKVHATGNDPDFL